MGRPAAVAEARPEPRSQVAADGRPIRRHGLVEADELDVPTWQRRRQEPPIPASERPVPVRRPAVAASDGADDDYDVPTFLRRGAD